MGTMHAVSGMRMTGTSRRAHPLHRRCCCVQIASTVMLTFILVAGYFVQNIYVWIAWLKCVMTSCCARAEHLTSRCIASLHRHAAAMCI